MATEVKRRRGTTSEHASFTGAVAELTVDLTKDTVVVHDGATQAGFPLLREDFSNAIFTVPDARYLLESNNLSDLDNVSTARDNLGLGASDDVTFNTVTADLIGDVTGNITGDVTGDLTGAIHVQGKNDTGGTLTKGTPVYISGQVAQGQQFTIGVADSDGSGTMPSIGILSANVNDNAMGDIVTHGKLIGIDTSSFTVGDELFIGSSGTLVNTPPTGESNLLQKIAKVIRVDSTDGQIYIMGAGRTNAVPNLDEGKIFAGDANNKAVTTNVIDVNIASNLVTINNDLTVTGVVRTNELDAQADLVWNTATEVWNTSDYYFTGAINLAGSLYITDELDVAESLTVGTTLDVTGNTTISGTLDAPTLNTGQGDNELYAMNQNVRTSDSVTFGALTVSGATVLSSTLQVDGTITVNDDIETADFSSWFTTTPSGFQISQAGVGDFRTLYIDELVAKAFTADVAQALAGSDILTKSVAKLNASFVVPNVGASVSITVEDLEGLSGLQVFEAGDHVRARVVDSTSGLTILDVYGTVSNYASVAGGTQTWDYTITYAGASNGAVGKTVNKGNILLDYGTSGSFYIERTVLDRSSGSDFTKVPYNRIVKWTNTVSGSPRAGDPDTVITVITQSGNLANLTSTYSNVSGFGFFGDNTFLTGSLLVGDLSKAGNYLEYTGSTMNVVTDTFDLDATDLDITNSNGGLIQIAHDTTTIPIKFGKTNTGSAPNYDGKYGLEIGSNNYWKVVDGFVDAADYVEFRVGTGTNFIDFNGTTIDIEVDTFDLNAQTLVIDSGTNNGKIALGATPPTGITSGSGIYFDGTGDALIGDATGNRIKFDFSASALEIQSDDFDLSAGNLLIDSGTTSLGSYTPTDATSIITNADFSSTVNFKDHPLDPSTPSNPSGDFGYLDDSVGWEADRTGSSTFSYDASGDYVQFTIDSSNGSNAIKMWQDEGWSDSGTSGTLSSYFGKTLTYTFDIRTAPTANGFQYGELFLRVYAYKNITDNTQASGYDYFQIAETKIVSSDLSGSSSTSIDVSAVIRSDYQAIRWSVEFDNFDTTSKAQDQYIFVYDVTLGAYDQTKVTLNSNGLSVFNSPIKQFTADSNGFEMVGMDIKTGGLQVPDIGSVQNLKTPDVGYLSVGAVDVGSSFRLYIKDSDGNAKYVTISTS